MAWLGSRDGVPEAPSGTKGVTFHGRTVACPAPCVAALAVVVLGLLAALGAAQGMQAWNARVASERFQVAATRVASLVEGRMARYAYAVQGARGAVAVAGDAGITRAGFGHYARTRDVDREFPGARGFGFIRRVPAAEVAAFTMAARRDGAPDFQIRQLQPHDGERWVIQYVEPVARNGEALGLDVASEAYRRAAARQAMETGAATMTAPITLVQATGLKERGFLLYLPVTRLEAPAGTPDERRAATVGWTYAPLIIDEVLAGLDIDGDEFDVAIRDVSPEAVVRFYSGQAAAPAGGLVATRRLAIHGRTWEVEVAARPPFLAGLNRARPVTVAVIVFVGALLVAGLIYLHLAGRRRDVLAAIETGRLAAIVESAQDAIVGKTLEGVITDYNPAAEQLFGYTAEEAIGRRAEDLVVPGHLLREEAEALVRIRQGRAVAPYCTVRARKDGGLVPVQVSASPIRAPDGTVSGVATVIRDITRQVESEERIRAANASLERQVAERTAALKAGSALQRAVLDHAGYAVIATDMQGTITLFNPAAERMLGYAADALVGRASPALFHDPVEVAQQARRLSLELGRTIEPGFEVFVARARLGQPNSDAWTYLTRGGERLPVLLNVSILRAEDGQELGFLGIAMDLSERHRHEAEMRAAQAGTWSYEVATGRVRLSAECARQHGLPERGIEIDVAREWTRLAHPDDVPQVLADLERAVESGGSYTTEFRIPLREGGMRWIAAIGRVETDVGGRSRRVIGLTLDISARKEAEIALAEAKAVAEAARAEAERANRAKTDFLAAMSHEIRTPLNAVIGFTDLMLASGRLDPGNRRQAELVRSSGSALLTVVNDILDFSKVEAGAVALVERPFALPALVETCVLIVRGQADAKGLDLRLRMDPALPRWLLGDENRLRQVLFNLLNNAVKFTGAGSITLDIAPEVGIAGDERLHFRVIDTGIGIPQEKQSWLFQRFSQVDGSIQRDYGGTGLGLAICRHLVRLMGGEIGVSSVDGCGSTFWFTVRMPRASAPESVPAVASAPVARCAGRLLLVDDSPINRELARAVLEGAGHAVVAVADGQAAVEAVRAGGFDLVLMDVQMPGMDGMTATRLIRSLPGAAARLPVIAMTANVLPDQVAAFHEAGMDDHVGKPFDRDTLCGTIERWLPAGPAPAAAERDAAARSAVRRLLAPSRLREVLRHLVCELDVGFDGDPAVEEVRARLRHRAHALSSAAAMMGFCDLAAACRDLEALDEASSAADGLDGFLAVLARVRRLADRAARSAESMLRELERAPEACSVRTNSA
ncbi:PAS domain S-box protein [Methylobacterium sp. CCH5-D2]|uniref:PAS domain S-box protein n=1 Tax=Methylobacterium sp. CCH5-D2 TaxID=1768765 RepID=UPI0008323434|nr:PAS domain S-box protein [Methylobacterium sp. CCH5-D2]